MSNDIVPYDEPVFADDQLITMADQAERRIDAVMKIKKVALKVTNANDWVDQNGKPYMMASAAKKIANLFNISWRIDEPKEEPEEDGHYTYTYTGTFSMGGRSIQIEGSRSSKDGFFRQYSYDGNKKSEKSIYERDNRRDVKMAALTNLLGNGITRLLGMRNLTYAELEEFAGIKPSDLGKVEYKKEGKQQQSSVKRHSEKNGKSMTPQEQLKKELTEHCNGDAALMKAVLKQISYFKSDDGEKWIDDIDKAGDKWCNTSIGKLRKLETKKPDEPKVEGVPKDCPKDPNQCSHSGWSDGIPYCGPDGPKCSFFEVQGEL